MKKVGTSPKPASTTAAKPAAKKKTARAKGMGKKPAVKTAGKQGFPRTTWQDTDKLGKEIGKGQQALSRHPRITHTEPNRTRPEGGGTTRPPIQARYGIATPRPPIQARYGIARPNPDIDTNPRPPIQMKYGIARPDPGTKPPIQMKYGISRPDPDNKPPIQMKYGIARPKPDGGVKRH